MIERNGKDFKYFDFKNDDELLRLHVKNNNDISNLPASQDYIELITTIVLRSEASENSVNISEQNKKKVEMIKELLPELLKNNKVSVNSIASFFNIGVENKWIEDGNLSNAELNKDLYLECLKIKPSIFNKTYRNFQHEDFEILFNYINYSIISEENYKEHIDFSMKMKAKEMGISLENYINNKYLEKKLCKELSISPKVKSIKI